MSCNYCSLSISTCAPPWPDAVVALSSDGPDSPYPRPLLYTSVRRADVISASSISTDDAPISQSRLSVKHRRNAPSKARDRLHQRRERHRALDVDRRQKEKNAISTLHRLIRQQHQASRVEDAVDECTEENHQDEMQGRKAGRLAVLELSIALIQQLTSASQLTEHACIDARDAQVSREPSQLHGVASVDGPGPRDGSAPLNSVPWHPFVVSIPDLTSPPGPIAAPVYMSPLPLTTWPYPAHSDISHTLLQSTTTLLSHMSMTVMALPSKVLTEVNDVFLSMTGFRRVDLLDQPFGLVSLSKGISQYPASVAAVAEVLDGHKRQGSATWRCRRADGVLFECLASFYGRYAELPPEGGEIATRLPDEMLIMCVPDEAVIVGEVIQADFV